MNYVGNRLYKVKFFDDGHMCYVVADTFEEARHLVDAYIAKQKEIYSDMRKHYEIAGIWDTDADLVITGL